MDFGKHNKHIVSGVVCATIGLGIAYIVKRHQGNVLKKLKNINVGYSEIIVVNSIEECELMAKNIQSKCSQYRVLGFDCEWVTLNGKRRPIALMQIASSDGYCTLIRLCRLQKIPPTLQTILEDSTILKVGVASVEDARYLHVDYGISMQGCLDLRHVADHLPRGGLNGMAQHYLGVELDKSWQIRCSNWEASKLSEKQLKYAAEDALVAVQILTRIMQPWWQLWGLPEWSRVWQACHRFRDVRYKSKPNRASAGGRNSSSLNRPGKPAARAFSTRQRPLYDNCFLQAPDGEVLSTIERRKAEWYVTKGLGEKVDTEPFTVRLNFEPSGRAMGEVGMYNVTEKENQCVVCGNTESYIRKNIVPHEYRRYFPSVMKDHMSHDILLLCLTCHLQSNNNDVVLRQKLADECNAPIGSQEDAKMFEVPELKKVRSAARALNSMNAHKIPADRRKELENIIRLHFSMSQDEQFTSDVVEEANTVVTSVMNASYQPHGYRVVTHYAQNGGLIQLEQLWREHFVTQMQPKFLPPLWSVTHNEERLIQFREQGRILPEEITVAGIAS